MACTAPSAALAPPNKPDGPPAPVSDHARIRRRRFRSADRPHRFLDALEQRRGIARERPAMAQALSRTHLRLRCLSTLPAARARSRRRSGPAGLLRREPRGTVGRADALARGPGGVGPFGG